MGFHVFVFVPYPTVFHLRGCGWLVVSGFNASFNSKCRIMTVGDTHVFPSFPTPVLKQLFFPKPPTTFLTCSCRGERRKYARKKVCLNQELNSQPLCHESGTLATEPLRRGFIFEEPPESISVHPFPTTKSVHTFPTKPFLDRPKLKEVADNN